MTRGASDLAAVCDSGLLDGAWYRQRYPDVDLLGLEPADHFVRIGAWLLRDPGPGFETAFYLGRYRDVLASGMNPLVHYHLHGRSEGRVCRSGAGTTIEPATDEPLQRCTPGARVRDPQRPIVLLCAHDAGPHAFGGERSFLDVLEGLARIGLDVCVALPRGAQPGYRRGVLRHAVEVIELALPWWRASEPPDAAVVAELAAIIAGRGVSAVHANTIMLREPLVAARAAGVPAIVHARELVAHDPDLCELVGASPERIREEVLGRADWVFANSEATARAFDKPGRRTVIVPNTVDPALFALPAPVPGSVQRIAMVSSNLPKKGLADFAEVARLLEPALPRARFLLVGPDNAHVRRLRAGEGGPLPANLEFAGYRETPLQAIAMADIVVNLSHFAESFGRSVLEAMAGARAVVAYDWGALPELLEDGRTGLLVPRGDLAAVAAAIEWLCAEPRRIATIGQAARSAACGNYGRTRFDQRLHDAYAQVLSP